MKVLVLGYIIRGPLGGLAWHHFQYILGLKQIGHEVLFLEDSDEYPSCYNPERFETTIDPGYGLQFIKELFDDFALNNHWAYFDYHTAKWYGQSSKEVLDFCNSADLVINISGVNPLRDWWTRIPARVFVDTDPVFTQIKHLTDAAALERARAHTHFATFGENFRKKDCTIPDDHLPWFATRQPLFLGAWKISGNKADANWTTVMQWDSYKEGIYEGKTYGMKSVSFNPYISLPDFVRPDSLELALGSPGGPGMELTKAGWIITDPFKATKDPIVFQKYIANSKGEWTIAKHGYVTTNSGWFSERTLNYMASGKPVVIQDTGLEDIIPIGKGVLTFSSPAEAADQIKAINKEYAFHCLQARNIAEEYFESSKVLLHLLDQL